MFLNRRRERKRGGRLREFKDDQTLERGAGTEDPETKKKEKGWFEDRGHRKLDETGEWYLRGRRSDTHQVKGLKRGFRQRYMTDIKTYIKTS